MFTYAQIKCTVIWMRPFEFEFWFRPIYSYLIVMWYARFSPLPYSSGKIVEPFFSSEFELCSKHLWIFLLFTDTKRVYYTLQFF